MRVEVECGTMHARVEVGREVNHESGKMRGFLYS